MEISSWHLVIVPIWSTPSSASYIPDFEISQKNVFYVFRKNNQRSKIQNLEYLREHLCGERHYKCFVILNFAPKLDFKRIYKHLTLLDRNWRLVTSQISIHPKHFPTKILTKFGWCPRRYTENGGAARLFIYSRSSTGVCPPSQYRVK